MKHEHLIEKVNKENNRKIKIDEMAEYNCNLESGYTKLLCESRK